MQVITDGLLTDYQDEGGGKVIVLLHGWNDSAKGLIGLRKALAKHYRVVTPDLAGFGASQSPAKDWGLSDYAQFVNQFLTKLGVKQPLAIIGHSNGGAIAIKGLADGSLSASKLVLLGSAGIRGTERGKLSAIKLSTKIGKVVAAPLPNSLKTRLRKKLYFSIGSDLLVAEHMSGTFKKIVAEDIRIDAAKLELPCLLIYGEDDVQTPVIYGRLLHEQIGVSSLEIITGAGHYVHIDKTDIVVKSIEDFIQNNA